MRSNKLRNKKLSKGGYRKSLRNQRKRKIRSRNRKSYRNRNKKRVSRKRRYRGGAQPNKYVKIIESYPQNRRGERAHPPYLINLTMENLTNTPKNIGLLVRSFNTLYEDPEQNNLFYSYSGDLKDERDNPLFYLTKRNPVNIEGGCFHSDFGLDGDTGKKLYPVLDGKWQYPGHPGVDIAHYEQQFLDSLLVGTDKPFQGPNFCVYTPKVKMAVLGGQKGGENTTHGPIDVNFIHGIGQAGDAPTQVDMACILFDYIKERDSEYTPRHLADDINEINQYMNTIPDSEGMSLSDYHSYDHFKEVRSTEAFFRNKLLTTYYYLKASNSYHPSLTDVTEAEYNKYVNEVVSGYMGADPSPPKNDTIDDVINNSYLRRDIFNKIYSFQYNLIKMSLDLLLAKQVNIKAVFLTGVGTGAFGYPGYKTIYDLIRDHIFKKLKLEQNIKVPHLFGTGFFGSPRYLGTYTPDPEVTQENQLHVFDGYTFKNPYHPDWGPHEEGFFYQAATHTNGLNVTIKEVATDLALEPQDIEVGNIKFNECCFMNAWDPLSNGGNGNRSDESLDGYIGSLSDIAFRCNPEFNHVKTPVPYKKTTPPLAAEDSHRSVANRVAAFKQLTKASQP